MTDNTQPEALDLADWLEAVGGGPSAKRCAALLREQHARIAELEAQLESAGFTAADMATAEARGFRDGVASVAASAPAPSAHIKEPYTLAEIKAKIASNYYGAELLLQHAMALLDSASLAESVESEPAAHVQNPAEIEHVAGDVSKNGAGLDMTQQPVAQQGAASEPTPPKGEELRALSDRYWGREDLRDAHAAGVACGFALGVRALRTQQPCPTAPAAPALTQGAAIAAGAVYAELPDDVIDYVKGSYAFLQSTAPDGYAEEVFSLPPSATRNQRSLQDALQSDKRGWHPAAARQDSGDGKRSGPDAGVSASHGQAPATQQAVSSAVLKAIREANMQLVRTGDNAFMLVPYKVVWHWLAEYLVGMRTDLDDEIVACETVNDLRNLVEAARNQGAIHE